MTRIGEKIADRHDLRIRECPAVSFWPHSDLLVSINWVHISQGTVFRPDTDFSGILIATYLVRTVVNSD